MRLKKIIFIGFCLVLSMGLILVNVGICQPTKPDEAGTKLPAVTPEGKAPAPQAPEQVKPEGKQAVPGKPPEKEPGKSESREGC